MFSSSKWYTATPQFAAWCKAGRWPERNHPKDPFYSLGLTLIPVWISNHMSNKVWVKITYPIPNFNGVTVLFHTTPHNGCNYLSMQVLKLIHVTKRCPKNLRSIYSLLTTQIAKFIGPKWGPPGSCRPQMGPMLAPWTLLSGYYQTTSVHPMKQVDHWSM